MRTPVVTMRNYDEEPPRLIIDDGTGFFRFGNAVWGHPLAWVQRLGLDITGDAMRRRLTRTKCRSMWVRSERGRLTKFYLEEDVHGACAGLHHAHWSCRPNSPTRTGGPYSPSGSRPAGPLLFFEQADGADVTIATSELASANHRTSPRAPSGSGSDVRRRITGCSPCGAQKLRIRGLESSNVVRTLFVQSPMGLE